jgi:hypothetical protein
MLSTQANNTKRFNQYNKEQQKLLRKAGYNNRGNANVMWSDKLLDEFDLYLEGKPYDSKFYNFTTGTPDKVDTIVEQEQRKRDGELSEQDSSITNTDSQIMYEWCQQNTDIYDCDLEAAYEHTQVNIVEEQRQQQAIDEMSQEIQRLTLLVKQQQQVISLLHKPYTYTKRHIMNAKHLDTVTITRARYDEMMEQIDCLLGKVNTLENTNEVLEDNITKQAKILAEYRAEYKIEHWRY